MPLSTVAVLSKTEQEYDVAKEVLPPDYVTLHWATLNRATVKRRHFNGRQLIGATFKRSDN